MFCINTFTFVFSLLWHWLMPEQWNHWRVEVMLDTLWHSHHFVRWIKLFFLEKRCILWNCSWGCTYVLPGNAVCWRRPLGWAITPCRVTAGCILPLPFTLYALRSKVSSWISIHSVAKKISFTSVGHLKRPWQWRYGLVPPSQLLLFLFFKLSLEERSPFSDPFSWPRVYVQCDWLIPMSCVFQSQIAKRWVCSSTRELTEGQRRVCVDKKRAVRNRKW